MTLRMNFITLQTGSVHKEQAANSHSSLKPRLPIHSEDVSWNKAVEHLSIVEFGSTQEQMEEVNLAG